MKALLQSLLVGFMITSLVACSVMQTVRDLPPDQVRPSNQSLKNVHEGDHVKVWTKSGDVRELTFSSLDESMLNGTDAGQAVQIPRDQITRLDVKKFSIIVTAMLGVVIVIVSAFVALANSGN